MENNKDVIILITDKSKDLALLDIEDYIFKLIKVFSPDKFQKLSINPLQQDLLNFRKVIYKLKPYISISNNRLIQPYESIKKGYGILKVKKPGMLLRPIVSSIFSVTSGAEKYILKVLKPLVRRCSFRYTVQKTLLKNLKYLCLNLHLFTK